MTRKRSKRLIFVILLSLVLLIVCSCKFQIDERERSEQLKDIEYSFDPNTILESIRAGDTNLYVAQTPTPGANLQPPKYMVNWDQSEYAAINESVYNTVWHDNEGDWKLIAINFSLDCDEIAEGPQDGFFAYYQIIDNDINYSIIVRRILIRPQDGVIYVTEDKTTPALPDKKFIDIENLKITGDEAIRIAEQNGGADIRSSVNDQCYILASLSLNSIHKGWNVDYYQGGIKTLYFLTIDPMTGKVSKKR